MLVHAVLLDQARHWHLGLGATDDTPARLQADYVRELRPDDTRRRYRLDPAAGALQTEPLRQARPRLQLRYIVEADAAASSAVAVVTPAPAASTAASASPLARRGAAKPTRAGTAARRAQAQAKAKAQARAQARAQAPAASTPALGAVAPAAAEDVAGSLMTAPTSTDVAVAPAPGEQPASDDALPTTAEPRSGSTMAATGPDVVDGVPTRPDAATASAVTAGREAAADDFEWPPSTRIRYNLTGHYRGPVQGQAQVEWLREGRHYQMHLDVVVGLSFAPLLVRRMSSDGSLGPTGLRPERYDEEGKRAFGPERRFQLHFDDDSVLLSHGRRVPRPPTVQDTASQFGQLTWMLRREPERLVVGGRLELDLALPRRVDRWTYDVVATETIWAPFGPVEGFHLKPRPLVPPQGVLAPEIWIAPTLGYLPVRIVIHQDAETWIDLAIDRPPEQAATR